MNSSLISNFKSSTRRALFVGSDKVSVYHWVNNNIGNSYLFDASVEGFENFGRYLSEVANDPMYVLLDTPVEEYRLDTIPHVFGADRKALIGRKQDRAFRGTPYLYSEVQGREESGRRDDNIMLSAITSPDVITPWLKVLEANKVPVAGLVTVPLLLQEIKNIVPDMQDNALVFSLQSIGGLRQSFFRDKSLKFSRLVKMPRYGTQHYPPILSEELDKIRRYVTTAHLADDKKPLDIYFFGNQELLTELGKEHINSAQVRYHLLDTGDLAKECGFEQQTETPFSDKYFIYHLLKNKCKNRFAGNKDLRYFQMNQMNKSLRVASFLFMMSGIIWGGMNVLEGLTYRQQKKSDAAKADFYQVRYEVARERISALPVDPADLSTVVDAKNVLEKYQADPVDMFRLISKGLEAFPDIQISNIQWSANTDPNYKSDGEDFKNTVVKRVQNVPGLGNIGDTETAYINYQIAMFHAHLENFDGDYRKALATIDSFSTQMSQLDSVHEVSVLSLPLDIGSDASLQGSSKKDATNANFSVRVVLGVKDEA
ncbi:MAG: hypothetical protein DRQ58_07960 [Gammaproteobacteria bacterium]|nr:MAG: hypothetical protein DRQ58_07960 [Gammaproteobacteria bacterium]